MYFDITAFSGENAPKLPFCDHCFLKLIQKQFSEYSNRNWAECLGWILRPCWLLSVI